MRSEYILFLHIQLVSHCIVYRYYYQYNEDRLSVCTLTIHGLLHIPQDIRTCGPVWATWMFYMERFCSILQAAIRSRRDPWTNITRRIFHIAILGQLEARYNLDDELFVTGDPISDGPSHYERTYPDCESMISTNAPDILTTIKQIHIKSSNHLITQIISLTLKFYKRYRFTSVKLSVQDVLKS